jgi:beta-galactosidase
MGWLRKTFTVPADWKGRRLQLHFEALAGDAEIVVNGQTVDHHFDIFLPFDVDITDLIKPGQMNELRVGIRKPSLFDKRGSFGRRPYQAGSFWGQHIAGIWQDVDLVALPVTHISNVYVRPLVDSGRLEVELAVTNDGARMQKLDLDAEVRRWKPAVPPLPSTELSPTPALIFPPVTVTVPAHTTIHKTISISVSGRLQLWSPDSPALYGLIVRLHETGAATRSSNPTTRTLDTRYTRFGWRQTQLQNGQFLLNGHPFVLRGDSWHFLGIPQMTRRYAWAWFTAMRDANLNAVRLHAQPYPSFYLDMADEMGILVLDETAVWASDGGPKLDDPVFWSDSKQQLEQLLLRDRNHPSVFGWSVSNEVKPVVRNVLHGPQSMMDTLLSYFSIWAATCRRLDPSRPWISADGEDDGEGRLPVYIVHYGGTETMDRARKSGKPWGVGEAGNAYYATPQQVAETNGSRAYESFLGRMEGVAASSWSSLMAQRQREAVYRSVFNLVWYGLQPLALGMKDTTRPPSPEDGIFFTSFAEGQPGVQPERLGPYCTTLNPGYDPSLPLYRTWPLFGAIRDASGPTPSANPPVASTFSPSMPGGPAQTPSIPNPTSPASPPTSPVPAIPNPASPAPLLIDATNPLPSNSRERINHMLAQGGTVMIWGISPARLDALNQLLPATITLIPRTASSLELVTPDALTRGLTASDLYFSEQRPPEITTNGLDGPLVRQGLVLLQAAGTDWLKWNKQPEYAKTAMVLRSERETHPSGAVLVKIRTGGGQLLITTLPLTPRLDKAEKLIHHLLSNAGAIQNPAVNAGPPLRPSGEIIPDLNQLEKTSTIDEAWLNFWISSPRSLDDLLAEPDIPVVGLELSGTDAREIWLNDRLVLGAPATNPGNSATNLSTSQNPVTSATRRSIPSLRLLQGWNHFRVRLKQGAAGWRFTGRLTCNRPGFLAVLGSAMEKP